MNIWKLLLVLALCLAVAGCGSGNNDEPGGFADDPEEFYQEEPEERAIQVDDLEDEEIDDYLEEDIPDVFDPVYLKVTGSTVNLRSGPGTRFDVAGTARQGDQLEVIFIMDHWIKVKTKDGKEAFVAGWYTDKNLPVPDQENLREEKMLEIN